MQHLPKLMYIQKYETGFFQLMLFISAKEQTASSYTFLYSGANTNFPDIHK